MLASPTKLFLSSVYVIFAFFAHILDNDARPLQERYKMTAEPQLVWHWLTPAPIYSLLVYFLFLLAPLVLSGNFVLLSVVLAALAFSLLFDTGGKGEAARATGVASPYWGSVWCYAIHCIVVVLCFVK